MVKHINALNLRNNLLAILRVADIGVTLARLLVAMMFVKKEAASGHPVLKGNGFNCHRTVREDDFLLIGIDGMKLQVVTQPLAVIIQLWTKQFLQIRMRIDMQRLGTAHHIEGGNHT